MSVLAMKVLAAHPHPNADALRVYELGAPELSPIVVIANLENVYEVGDVVAVARVGATLADGTQIRKARLRGVDSFGMALGRVDDAPGTDLSARFAAAAPPDVPVVSWTSIELFHHVRQGVEAAAEVEGATRPVRTFVRLTATSSVLVREASGANWARATRDGARG